MHEEIERLTVQAQEHARRLNAVLDEIKRVIVGQHYVLHKLLMCLIADGHVLLEGVPGLAKTLMVKTLSSAFSARFHRIQFTPDLLPADITGTKIYDHRTASFSTQKGPIFCNFMLADEINRAPPKVQSALLEAMQERQVSIQGETFALDKPFLVLATQNPIETEGTYKLPEAQVDRFTFKLLIAYPKREEEKTIIARNTQGLDIRAEKRGQGAYFLAHQKIALTCN
jgi:MoxR-like ATPases